MQSTYNEKKNCDFLGKSPFYIYVYYKLYDVHNNTKSKKQKKSIVKELLTSSKNRMYMEIF